VAHHSLAATPETIHWGYFDGALPPVLSIESGDVVAFRTLSGAPDVLPPPGFDVPPELLAIHERCDRILPGHILTGPVEIRGAKPGDTLEVRIEHIELAQDWGWNAIRPGMGTLPEDFPETRILNVPIDMQNRRGRLPWGLDVPLKPFFGVMGVAPPDAWGRIQSLIPRGHGGNLDNRHLRPGATLLLPVLRDGAMFSCGDGHAAQGDGEVCLTAIETALNGRLRFILRRNKPLAQPRAETRTSLITMGTDEDLDRAVQSAVRDMVAWIGETAGLSRTDAYTLCSVAADVHVTQFVNVNRGAHCILRKAFLASPGSRRM
jgi:acetamidase/formamidase